MAWGGIWPWLADGRGWRRLAAFAACISRYILSPACPGFPVKGSHSRYPWRVGRALRLLLNMLEFAVLPFEVEIPFVSHLGFTLHKWADGESELHYHAQAAHLNSFDVTHGGASMTLLDVTMAHAARSAIAGSGAVTIEMKTSFMATAKGPLVAKGKLLSRTKTMAFCEAWLYDEAGKLCCHATGTFKYVMPEVVQSLQAAKKQIKTD